MMVCSGVFLVGYGADVTPRIFYENFIDVMVNIDRSDGTGNVPHAVVMVRSSGGNRVVGCGFYTG
ncbi:hypothetical protein FQ185_26265 [Pseudomonas sp. ANT_H12B]|nr:hypothetical protein FQ185_26265 [Pseudomonas sp. ANT_H12B]